ncbi:MAG: ABC transporter substrate-binding protein [Burkholderiaceae bacterium]|nr:ABC transporter substrate-binding protein [Burkholderiaceae bacterium]
MATLCVALVFASPAAAQPLEGGLKIVVGYAPGGASDRAARLVADALRVELGTTVIVENKTGAGGRLSAQQVKATPPGQNVLMMGNPAINVVAPLVFSNVGYDQYKDFVPVSQVTQYDFAVAVGAAVPVREFRHLLAWLRANPEQANFAVPATGSLPHFFALMIAEKAGVKAQVIGYRGSAPAITDLIGGQVPVGVDTLDSMLAQHEGGKLRILSVGAAKRSTDTSNLPTLRESGVDVVADGWNVLFAPASMPPERIARLARAIEKVMKDPAVQSRFRAANMVPVASSQQQTAKMLEAYRAKWEPVVKASGIQQ